MGFDPQIAIDWARGQNSVVALLAFATVNVVGTSVLPIPIGVAMMVIGGVLFGQVTGLVVYLATSTIGAFITFAIVRALKDRVIGWLGQHAATWRRLDAAITREGLWICFLWRVAPIAPYVVSSAMISMTEISAWDYMWTTALGIIPSSFPIVSGAAMAGTVLIEKKEMDPTTLTVNVLSIGAGIYVMIRLGAIAMEVMAKSGMQDDASVPVGYMINERDEIFEAKVFHDSRWPWPRGDVQRDVLAMRELLHTVALACLRSLAAPLGLDAEKLHAHLDRTNPHDGSLRGSLEHCSNTSMRIYRYAARGLGNNVHTDNTLLTVSPPGSAIGLCASMPPRPDGQGGAARSRVVRPEAHMAPDELLLFAGDALSFLSRGRIPALVHWVEAPPGEAPRFSMPFFLRPRLDALLDPDGAAAAGPVKVGNPAGDIDERAAAQAGMMGDGRHLLVAVPPLQPVLQRAIEANVHNVRRSWPWKQGNDYYAPAVYPSDEGHAPVAVQLLTT